MTKPTLLTTKKTLAIFAAALLLSIALFGIVNLQTASAQSIKKNLCEGSSLSLSVPSSDPDVPGRCADTNGDGKVDENDGKAENSLNNLITAGVNILTVIVGIVAVIMIIIGGFKYITSSGDSGRIASAKSTIIYAIVGLIIVALAQIIVRFVLNKAA